MKISCEQMVALLERDLALELTPLEDRALESHLAECPPCAQKRRVLHSACDALARLPPHTPDAVGQSRRSLEKRLRDEESLCVRYAPLESPVGSIFIARWPAGICAISIRCSDEAAFASGLAKRFGVPVLREPSQLGHETEELLEYFHGKRRSFDLPVDLSWMTPFQRDVLALTAEIPAGRIRTYGEIAQQLARPGASRAVGNALGSNPVPIVVPCHRVVASSGRLGGYSGGGPEVKRLLLEIEGVQLPGIGRQRSGAGDEGIRHLF